MDNTKDRIIEILKNELKQNVLDFLNHEYIAQKIENPEENTEFIMQIYDVLNDIDSIVKKSIKTRKIPENELFTEEEAFRRVIEYNRQAKEAKKKFRYEKSKKIL